MGLFDVLRYHVSDIYNEQEINALPIELVKSWLTKCLVDVELPSSEELHIGTWTKISPFTVPTLINFYVGRLTSAPSNADVSELVKDHFTRMLQHEILHYDEDIK